MNPGPAPRPPNNQPRLNLTPNTNLPGSMSNLPGGMSNMTISPIPRTATSTYTGSTISLPLARERSNNADGMGGVAVIKEGWAQVKENRNFIQPWKQKFLILRKESLDFHKYVIRTSPAVREIAHANVSHRIASAVDDGKTQEMLTADILVRRVIVGNVS